MTLIEESCLLGYAVVENKAQNEIMIYYDCEAPQLISRGILYAVCATFPTSAVILSSEIDYALNYVKDYTDIAETLKRIYGMPY